MGSRHLRCGLFQPLFAACFPPPAPAGVLRAPRRGLVRMVSGVFFSFWQGVGVFLGRFPPSRRAASRSVAPWVGPEGTLGGLRRRGADERAHPIVRTSADAAEGERHHRRQGQPHAGGHPVLAADGVLNATGIPCLVSATKCGLKIQARTAKVIPIKAGFGEHVIWVDPEA